MKKLTLLFSTLLLLSSPLAAQRVAVDNFDQLKVHFATPAVDIQSGNYLTLAIDGYILGGEVGAPAVPVYNNLLTVPFCNGMEVIVENAVYDTVALPVGRVMPLQLPRSKSDFSTPHIVLDEQAYATDAYLGRPLASVESIGTGRDRNYAVLTWSPVSVNPVSGKMVVCRSADVTVNYLGSDAGLTMKHYDLYNTPAFTAMPTLNKLYTNAKAVNNTAPIRMVVVAPQSLQCTALDTFVAWKRKQGMMVDLLYVANNSTADAIAAQLRQLYDDASAEAPAPAYLILVGDNNVLPAYNSRITQNYYVDNDHITDLYYVTWTSGDDLPDCYLGRFSATDTSTLRGIIQKTLYYEQYQFMDDSYLGKAVLISGVDQTYYVDTNDNAYTYADPTMDYIAYFYVNNEHGFNNVTYYKNNTNYAPEGVTVTGSSRSTATATTLRNLYKTGIGWINYSAHGNWNEWSVPEFTVSQVSSMTNNNKPSFMIGNCCLSNKFDQGTCFGEALLRRSNNAGAVGYIGGTNSTYWSYDFYWTVGVRSNIYNRMVPTYKMANKGMYDRLFHTHNESLSDQMVTAGKIIYAGNAAVNTTSNSSSLGRTFVQYYWEIYELMGDPSLLPWLGQAETLTGVTIVKEGNTLNVNAVPGAYVALVRGADYELLASGFTNANGVATLTVNTNDFSNCKLSITAQGYQPYYNAYSNHNVALQNVEEGDITVSPNPASTATEVRADGLSRVTLLNVMGQTLLTVNASDDHCTVNLTAVPNGLYLLRIEAASGISVRKIIKR